MGGAHPWASLEDKLGLKRRGPSRGRDRTALGRHASAQCSLVNSLGPCSRHWVPVRPADGHLRPIRRSATRCLPSCLMPKAWHGMWGCPNRALNPACMLARRDDEEGADDEACSSGRDTIQCGLPLSFKLAGSPAGKADLQLQLFSLHLGDACEHSSNTGGRRRRRRLGSVPAFPGEPAVSPLSTSAALTVIPSSWQACAHVVETQTLTVWEGGPADAARALEAAAGLLFLQLIFPDRAPGAARKLAWLGAGAAGAQAAARLLPQEQRERASEELRARSSRLLHSLDVRHGRPATAALRGAPCMLSASACSCLPAHRFS
jgi:hypothetical protein